MGNFSVSILNILHRHSACSSQESVGIDGLLCPLSDLVRIHHLNFLQQRKALKQNKGSVPWQTSLHELYEDSAWPSSSKLIGNRIWQGYKSHIEIRKSVLMHSSRLFAALWRILLTNPIVASQRQLQRSGTSTIGVQFHILYTNAYPIVGGLWCTTQPLQAFKPCSFQAYFKKQTCIWQVSSEWSAHVFLFWS